MPTGYKECPECLQLVPNSCPECIVNSECDGPCGYVFFRQMPWPDAELGYEPLVPGRAAFINVFTRPGKYKKLCPQCNGYINTCYNVCGCGYKFPMAADGRQQSITQLSKCSAANCDCNYDSDANNLAHTRDRVG